jgi:hypothetical protein
LVRILLSLVEEALEVRQIIHEAQMAEILLLPISHQLVVVVVLPKNRVRHLVGLGVGGHIARQLQVQEQQGKDLMVALDN